MAKSPALPSFDANAMMLHTWVADADLRVRHINRSYRVWLKNHLPDTEKKITGRVGLPLVEFLRQTMDIGREVEAFTFKLLEELRGDLTGPLPDQLPYRDNGIEVIREMDTVGDQLMGNVRVAGVGRFRAPGRLDNEAFEIRMTAQFRRADEGWTLQGLQGLIQSLRSRRAPVEFDPNAMLVYSWVADQDANVQFVNRSLRDWLRRNLRDTEDKINSKGGLEIKHFLQQILLITADVEQAILERLATLQDAISDRSQWESDPGYGSYGLEVKRDIYVVDTQSKASLSKDAVLSSFRERPEHLVAGVRAIALSGFPMRGKQDLEFVDIVIVAQTRTVAKGVWALTGYQGMLQSATMRAGLIFREGTRSGAVSLMGRNLSHNIGSHALYWLEHESNDIPPEMEEERDRQSKDFYKYLRERMELLAGFATSIPLSSKPVPFAELVDNFSQNKVLLKYLCKSESVDEVTIDYEDRSRYVVSVPGGAIGVQAFYSLLENIIRDNAKYGPHEGAMCVGVETVPVEDYIKVSIVGEEADNTDSAHRIIKEALCRLEITNEAGQLKDGSWGIKERFIAAALLRGIKLEDIGFTVERQAGSEKVIEVDRNLARTVRDRPPILNVITRGKRLIWEFYLLIAKSILLIDREVEEESGQGIDRHNMAWLQENIESPSAVRHALVSVSVKNAKDAEWLVENRGRLPYRTFLSGQRDLINIAPSGMFARFSENAELEEKDTLEKIYPHWLEWLEPDLTSKFILLHTNDDQSILRWDSPHHEPITIEEFKLKSRDPHCLGVFLRHWVDTQMVWPIDERLYTEIYGKSPLLEHICEQRTIAGVDKSWLFESALIRVLVVDERLDQTVEQIVYPGLKVTIRQSMAMKGIDIRGKEYSGSTVPQLGQLLQWASGRDGKPYHFICVHRGILDKLEKLHEITVAAVCEELEKLTPNMLVHSGRVGRTSLPDGIRIISLSNVVRWLDVAVSKTDVVNELCLIRV